MASQSKNGTDLKDAIALLKSDHRTVEGLFAQFETTKSGSKKGELARKVCIELIIHSTIEEEIFYPTFRGKIDDDILDEAYVEHDGAKLMITELLNGKPDDDFFDAKFTVLAEEIKHHIREEEKRGEGVFAQARETDVDLKELGAKLQARKDELKAEIAKSGPPTPVTRTLHNPKLKHGEPVPSTAV